MLKKYYILITLLTVFDVLLQFSYVLGDLTVQDLRLITYVDFGIKLLLLTIGVKYFNLFVVNKLKKRFIFVCLLYTFTCVSWSFGTNRLVVDKLFYIYIYTNEDYVIERYYRGYYGDLLKEVGLLE